MSDVLRMEEALTPLGAEMVAELGVQDVLEGSDGLHALEVLRLMVGAVASAVWEPGRLGGFTFAPWLAVLLLFVLSGVFAQGARMRADLEGTV